MNRFTYRVYCAAAFTAVAALAVINLRLAYAPIDISPISTSSDPAGSVDESGTVSLRRDAAAVSLLRFSETVERPLFSPDRRPPAPSADNTRDVPRLTEENGHRVSATALRLVGMMRVGTAGKRALIRGPDPIQAAWVDVGKQIGGWRVDAILDDQIVLVRDGARAELSLYAPDQIDNEEAE